MPDEPEVKFPNSKGDLVGFVLASDVSPLEALPEGARLTSKTGSHYECKRCGEFSTSSFTIGSDIPPEIIRQMERHAEQCLETLDPE
jgi:hypothetical protein